MGPGLSSVCFVPQLPSAVAAAACRDIPDKCRGVGGGATEAFPSDVGSVLRNAMPRVPQNCFEIPHFFQIYPWSRGMPGDIVPATNIDAFLVGRPVGRPPFPLAKTACLAFDICVPSLSR